MFTWTLFASTGMNFYFTAHQVFTCPLSRITEGINQPLQSDQNLANSINVVTCDFFILFYPDCSGTKQITVFMTG